METSPNTNTSQPSLVRAEPGPSGQTLSVTVINPRRYIAKARLVWALDELLVLRVVKIALVLMGGVVVWLSFKAWRRQKSTAMLFLSLGFALITAGAVAAGVLFEFLGYDLRNVSITEGIVQLLGFGMIIYSIYGRHN